MSYQLKVVSRCQKDVRSRAHDYSIAEFSAKMALSEIAATECDRLRTKIDVQAASM